MLLRILKSSFLKRPKAVLFLLLSITMGAAVATAFLGIYGEVSHKMALELRSYGANILVEPSVTDDGGELVEADLKNIKTVFWKYNITGFAPYLFGIVELEAAGRKERGVVSGTWFAKELQVEGAEPSTQGVRQIAPWWEIAGEWPQAADEAIVGVSLAKRFALNPGSEIIARKDGRSRRFKISGIVTTGGYEEEQLFAPLATVQGLLAKEGRISRVLVSALTVPMDEFGSRDPATMNKLEYEKWYCTAYVTSVAKNVEEVMTGSRAKPIWQIASAEGSLLKKFNLIIILLTSLALAASAIAVSTSLMASMAERQTEVALMKTLGADRFQVIAIFIGEILIISVIGGLLGYLLGDQLAELISRVVFNSKIKSPLWLFPTAILSAFAVAVAGSVAPLQRALLIKPVQVIKG
ncbi:ABC transporter, membrane protein [Geotalea daltonii FRC-32]|uniref:ABC transporter, membrane protein n=1 Tax=Geotalea daltonii (strain DSM 22248 / JCM 15807 / FRC-32) TaxID=316067 RepID=B9M7Y0_GEODF|nr:FtsX-like permease family protein [Geotalea daltonii]ACM18438.1 ABC transporter, membrane protein [Geotalea daltonii FRC-32]